MKLIESEAINLKKRISIVNEQMLKRSKARIRPSVIKSLQAQGFDEKVRITIELITEAFAEDEKKKWNLSMVCVGCHLESRKIIDFILKDFLPRRREDPRRGAFNRCCKLSELYETIVGMHMDKFLRLPSY